MTNIIGRVQKLGKHNRKRLDMTTNLLAVPVSFSFCHNTDDRNKDTTLRVT